MVTGDLLFLLVVRFILGPTLATSGALAPMIFRTLLGVALAACALSLFLRRRVPKRSMDESADMYWTTAIAPALITWTLANGASLLAVVLYMFTGEPLAVGVAVIAILVNVVLNPAYLARR